MLSGNSCRNSYRIRSFPGAFFFLVARIASVSSLFVKGWPMLSRGSELISLSADAVSIVSGEAAAKDGEFSEVKDVGSRF